MVAASVGRLSGASLPSATSSTSRRYNLFSGRLTGRVDDNDDIPSFSDQRSVQETLQSEFYFDELMLPLRRRESEHSVDAVVAGDGSDSYDDACDDDSPEPKRKGLPVERTESRKGQLKGRESGNSTRRKDGQRAGEPFDPTESTKSLRQRQAERRRSVEERDAERGKRRGRGSSERRRAGDRRRRGGGRHSTDEYDDSSDLDGGRHYRGQSRRSRRGGERRHSDQYDDDERDTRDLDYEYRDGRSAHWKDRGGDGRGGGHNSWMEEMKRRSRAADQGRPVSGHASQQASRRGSRRQSHVTAEDDFARRVLQHYREVGEEPPEHIQQLALQSARRRASAVVNATGRKDTLYESTLHGSQAEEAELEKALDLSDVDASAVTTGAVGVAAGQSTALEHNIVYMSHAAAQANAQIGADEQTISLAEKALHQASARLQEDQEELNKQRDQLKIQQKELQSMSQSILEHAESVAAREKELDQKEKTLMKSSEHVLVEGQKAAEYVELLKKQLAQRNKTINETKARLGQLREENTRLTQESCLLVRKQKGHDQEMAELRKAGSEWRKRCKRAEIRAARLQRALEMDEQVVITEEERELLGSYVVPADEHSESDVTEDSSSEDSSDACDSSAASSSDTTSASDDDGADSGEHDFYASSDVGTSLSDHSAFSTSSDDQEATRSRGGDHGKPPIRPASKKSSKKGKRRSSLTKSSSGRRSSLTPRSSSKRSDGRSRKLRGSKGDVMVVSDSDVDSDAADGKLQKKSKKTKSSLKVGVSSVKKVRQVSARSKSPNQGDSSTKKGSGNSVFQRLFDQRKDATPAPKTTTSKSSSKVASAPTKKSAQVSERLVQELDVMRASFLHILRSTVFLMGIPHFSSVVWRMKEEEDADLLHDLKMVYGLPVQDTRAAKDGQSRISAGPAGSGRMKRSLLSSGGPQAGHRERSHSIPYVFSAASYGDSGAHVPGDHEGEQGKRTQAENGPDGPPANVVVPDDGYRFGSALFMQDGPSRFPLRVRPYGSGPGFSTVRGAGDEKHEDSRGVHGTAPVENRHVLASGASGGRELRLCHDVASFEMIIPGLIRLLDFAFTTSIFNPVSFGGAHEQTRRDKLEATKIKKIAKASSGGQRGSGGEKTVLDGALTANGNRVLRSLTGPGTTLVTGFSSVSDAARHPATAWITLARYMGLDKTNLGGLKRSIQDASRLTAVERAKVEMAHSFQEGDVLSPVTVVLVHILRILVDYFIPPLYDTMTLSRAEVHDRRHAMYEPAAGTTYGPALASVVADASLATPRTVLSFRRMLVETLLLKRGVFSQAGILAYARSMESRVGAHPGSGAWWTEQRTASKRGAGASTASAPHGSSSSGGQVTPIPDSLVVVARDLQAGRRARVPSAPRYAHDPQVITMSAIAVLLCYAPTSTLVASGASIQTRLQLLRGANHDVFSVALQSLIRVAAAAPSCALHRQTFVAFGGPFIVSTFMRTAQYRALAVRVLLLYSSSTSLYQKDFLQAMSCATVIDEIVSALRDVLNMLPILIRDDMVRVEKVLERRRVGAEQQRPGAGEVSRAAPMPLARLRAAVTGSDSVYQGVNPFLVADSADRGLLFQDLMKVLFSESLVSGTGVVMALDTGDGGASDADSVSGSTRSVSAKQSSRQTTGGSAGSVGERGGPGTSVVYGSAKMDAVLQHVFVSFRNPAFQRGLLTVGHPLAGIVGPVVTSALEPLCTLLQRLCVVMCGLTALSQPNVAKDLLPMLETIRVMSKPAPYADMDACPLILERWASASLDETTVWAAPGSAVSGASTVGGNRLASVAGAAADGDSLRGGVSGVDGVARSMMNSVGYSHDKEVGSFLSANVTSVIKSLRSKAFFVFSAHGGDGLPTASSAGPRARSSELAVASTLMDARGDLSHVALSSAVENVVSVPRAFPVAGAAPTASQGRDASSDGEEPKRPARGIHFGLGPNDRSSSDLGRPPSGDQPPVRELDATRARR